MKLRCASCAAQKKKKTATIMHEGDSLCLECYEKKLAHKAAEQENAARMKALQEQLERLSRLQEEEKRKK